MESRRWLDSAGMEVRGSQLAGGGDKEVIRRPGGEGDCHLIEFSEGGENKTVHKFNKKQLFSLANVNILIW